jgi:hypothetical protein
MAEAMAVETILEADWHGHSIIDLARELNRYMNPTVRFAGRGNAAAREVKEDLARKILIAFGRNLETSFRGREKSRQ